MLVVVPIRLMTSLTIDLWVLETSMLLSDRASRSFECSFQHAVIPLRENERWFDCVCLVVEGRHTFGHKIALEDMRTGSLVDVMETVEARLDVHAVVLLCDHTNVLDEVS